MNHSESDFFVLDIYKPPNKIKSVIYYHLRPNYAWFLLLYSFFSATIVLDIYKWVLSIIIMTLFIGEWNMKKKRSVGRIISILVLGIVLFSKLKGDTEKTYWWTGGWGSIRISRIKPIWQIIINLFCINTCYGKTCIQTLHHQQNLVFHCRHRSLNHMGRGTCDGTLKRAYLRTELR